MALVSCNVEGSAITQPRRELKKNADLEQSSTFEPEIRGIYSFTVIVESYHNDCDKSPKNVNIARFFTRNDWSKNALYASEIVYNLKQFYTSYLSSKSTHAGMISVRFTDYLVFANQFCTFITPLKARQTGAILKQCYLSNTFLQLPDKILVLLRQILSRLFGPSSKVPSLNLKLIEDLTCPHNQGRHSELINQLVVGRAPSSWPKRKKLHTTVEFITTVNSCNGSETAPSPTSEFFSFALCNCFQL